MMDDVDPNDLEFTPAFWNLFFDTMREMAEANLLPEHPDEESASLFFTYLATKMIERSEGPMPSLEHTILILNQLLARELPKIVAAIDELLEDKETTYHIYREETP